MKKIISIILCLCMVIAVGCVMAGCGNDEVLQRLDDLQAELQTQSGKIEELQTELQTQNGKIDGLQTELQTQNGKIDELQSKIEEMDGQLLELDERIEKFGKELSVYYNEAGGFYECQANDYISVYPEHGTSVFSYYIRVKHDDENLIFLYSVEYGHFANLESSIELKSGEDCHLGFDTFLHSTEYLDVIAKNGDKIIGYGVVGFIQEATNWWGCKVLKFAFLPQLGGKYQTVSEDQIKKAMDEIKN